METPELVFIPAPGIGHLVSMAEFAKRLVDRDDRLSITVLVIRAPVNPEVQTYVQSIAVSNARIRLIILPLVDSPPVELLKCPEKYVSLLIESYKSHVMKAIDEHVPSFGNSLAGIVIDFFATSMIDVANELNVSSYLFFTSSAAFLGFLLHLKDHHKKFGKIYDINDSDSIVSTYANPVPTSVLPSCVFNADGYGCFLDHGSRFKETKGFLINTFFELEPYAVNALSCDEEAPPVYTVGPLLDLENGKRGAVSEREEIIKWLDGQPDSSVVFLCFGSLGGFDQPQIAQMAIALESSGYRFLWSVRPPKVKSMANYKNGYSSNLEEILPEGFLERTKNRGKLCGWAPQVDVLGHEAIGAFVSHCGWNSTLESLWYGVPIVAWPIYAEQQLNAFEMVRELGLGVELRIDYRVGNEEVGADEIERALRSVMDGDNVVKRRVREMKEKCRKALSVGGSSFESTGCFIEKIVASKRAKVFH